MNLKELKNFIKTFESLLFSSQKEIKNLYDNEYNNNPFNKEVTYETEDVIYKMRVSIVSEDKTNCKDCTLRKGSKCYWEEDVVFDKKKYCTFFTTDKSCEDCKYIACYSYGEMWCKVDGDYFYENNKSKKCEKWELDI